jgi:hypothetical protein
MDILSHVIKIYQKDDGYIEVLTAGVKNIDHILYAIKPGSEI